MMSPTTTGAAASQASAVSFSALPITRSTSGIAAKLVGSICAAHPVTAIRALGRRRCACRIPAHVCLQAAWVTDRKSGVGGKKVAGLVYTGGGLQVQKKTKRDT